MTSIAHRIQGQIVSLGESLIPPGQQEVMQLYGDLVEPERLLYPESSADAAIAESALLQNLVDAKRAGKHIAIVDGAFDVPHDNHTWYLREARMRAANRHFGSAFSAAPRLEKQAMVASDDVLLIVTLDADEKIAAKKGFSPEKGNVARPIYTWDARAHRIGGFVVPTGFGGHRPVLDLVTVEGDTSHVGTMFESHLLFGRKLLDRHLLDTWVMFNEHEETLRSAADIAQYAISVVEQDQARFSIDPRTGKWWSSSAIISMIKESTDVSLSKEPQSV